MITVGSLDWFSQPSSLFLEIDILFLNYLIPLLIKICFNLKFYFETHGDLGKIFI